MKKTILICDKDGQREATETMLVTYNGGRFTIDACGDCARELKEQLFPILKVGMHTGGQSPFNGKTKKLSATAAKPLSSVNGKAPTDPMQNKAIRDWAAKKGIPCPERGKIPDRVQAAFQEAHA